MSINKKNKNIKKKIVEKIRGCTYTLLLTFLDYQTCYQIEALNYTLTQ